MLTVAACSDGNSGSGTKNDGGAGTGGGMAGAAGSGSGAAGTGGTVGGTAGTSGGGGAGSGGAGSGAAGSPGRDGGADSGARDSGPVGGGGAGGGDGGTSASCGMARPMLTGWMGSGRMEGVVIGSDGSIYYGQSNAVGRLKAGGMPQNTWARIPDAGTIWGLAIDVKNQVLYAGVPGMHNSNLSAGKIYKITLADTPTVAEHVATAGNPNGLTMGPDGDLYYTDHYAHDVYRVSATGMRTKVNTSQIMRANGLAFYGGDLFVLAFMEGKVYRLKLTNGMETSRMEWATGMPNADGIAFDAMGRAWVGANGGLYMVPAAGGAGMRIMGVGGGANVEFGAGALRCTDIYVAGGNQLVRYEMNDVPGAPVSWH